MGGVAGDRSALEVAHDDTARGAVDDHQVEHLAAHEHAAAPERDLALQRLIRAEQQLLAGLAARVERARDLRAAERSVGQRAAVLPRERHALRDALIDDARRQLRQAIDVGLARPKVTALDRVVEEAAHAVAVVLVVLGGVDAALRGDAVRAPRAVLEADAGDVVPELRERRGRRRAGEPGADDDDAVAAAIGWAD